MKKDVNLVDFCAKLSKIAYSDPKRNTKKLKINDKLYEYEFLDESDCQAYIFYDESDFIVVVRGSSEKSDFISSASFKSKRDKEIKAKVHRGFKSYSDLI